MNAKTIAEMLDLLNEIEVVATQITQVAYELNSELDLILEDLVNITSDLRFCIEEEQHGDTESAD